MNMAIGPDSESQDLFDIECHIRQSPSDECQIRHSLSDVTVNVRSDIASDNVHLLRLWMIGLAVNIGSLV